MEPLIIPYMAITSRLCGSKSILPWGLEQWAYAAPYAIATFILLLPTVEPIGGNYPYHVWLGALLAYLGAVFGKRLGHGEYIDLGGFWKGKAEPEKIDFIVRLICGEDKAPSYWRDAIGLAVTGMVCTLLCGLIVSVSNPITGLFLALSGATKAPAYMIGKFMGFGTEGGEWLTGAFAGLALVFALLLN